MRNSALQNGRPRVVHSQESPRTYLDRHYIPLYLNDVTTLLLRIRPAAPLDFIASYFSEVLNGTHVLLREFAYVSACPHNRWSFVRVVQESFAGVSPAQHELSAVDLLQLLRLFCPDFPLELVMDACKLCGDGDGAYPTDELLLAWRARFYYAEFLQRTAEVFETCDTRAQGVVDRNVLCLTCRQMLSANSPQLKRMPCPPPAVFDELLVDDRGPRPPLAPTLVPSPPPSSRGGGGHQQSVALDRLLNELSKEGEGNVAASLPRRRGKATAAGARRASSTAAGAGAGAGRTAAGCGSARSAARPP